MRLVSLCPSNTELTAYAGLEQYLVGADNYSDWPASVHNLTRVGPDLSIDIAKVAELKPDLVLASRTVPGMEKNIEGLEKEGLPYVTVPSPTTLSDVGKQLLWFGEQTGFHEAGQKSHDIFYSWISKYRELSERVKQRKSVYWEWWGKPVFTPGRDNWLTEMSELAGGRNIFGKYEKSSVKTDWEDVRKKDPDVAAVVWVGVDQHRIKPEIITKRPGWPEMRAVSEKQLHILKEPYFCRPSPRLLIGLMTISAILHPDIYPPYTEGFDPMSVFAS